MSKLEWFLPQVSGKFPSISIKYSWWCPRTFLFLQTNRKTSKSAMHKRIRITNQILFKVIFWCAQKLAHPNTIFVWSCSIWPRCFPHPVAAGPRAPRKINNWGSRLTLESINCYWLRKNKEPFSIIWQRKSPFLFINKRVVKTNTNDSFYRIAFFTKTLHQTHFKVKSAVSHYEFWNNFSNSDGL